MRTLWGISLVLTSLAICLVVLGLSTGTAAQHGCAAVTVGVDFPTLERNRDSSPRGVTARVGKCGIQFG